MSREKPETVADVDGPWVEPEIQSGLIDRCRRGWNVPVALLTNDLLATYLRQKIGLALVVPEARRRLDAGYVDGTELYDEELGVALAAVEGAA